MSLKEKWTDKVDGQDFVEADDINQIARAVIDLELQNESFGEEIGKIDDLRQDLSDFIDESAEKIDGLETNVSDSSERIRKLESDVADLMYVPIEVTAFSVTPASAEKGQTFNSVSFVWALNKTPQKIAIGSNELAPTQAGTMALDGLEITTNHDWTIVATDERGTQASKKATINFYNGVYYGVSAIPEAYDSAFIIALGKSGKKTLRSSKLAGFSVNAGEGKYIFYCLPTSMGLCSFKVGGFDGGFELVATPAYTNEYGHTEAYYIYRSTNAALGETTVEVK